MSEEMTCNFKVSSIYDGDVAALTICDKGHETKVWFKGGKLTVEGGHDETAKIFFDQVFKHAIESELTEQVRQLREALSVMTEHYALFIEAQDKSPSEYSAYTDSIKLLEAAK